MSALAVPALILCTTSAQARFYYEDGTTLVALQNIDTSLGGPGWQRFGDQGLGSREWVTCSFYRGNEKNPQGIITQGTELRISGANNESNQSIRWGWVKLWLTNSEFVDSLVCQHEINRSRSFPYIVYNLPAPLYLDIALSSFFGLVRQQ